MGSLSGQLSSMSAPAPVSKSLGEAGWTGWTGWTVRFGYLWNSISHAPCNSQEHHREAAEKDFVWAYEGDSTAK